MPETARAFFCVEIPSDVRNCLYDSSATLRMQFPALKWVVRDSLHITLKFLGELDVSAVDDIAATFGQKLSPAGLSEIPLCTGEYGAFPGLNRARTLYIQVKGEIAALSLLASICDSAARINGIDDDRRPFRPHVTLARARQPEYLESAKLLPPAVSRWIATTVTLMRSELNRAGSIYTPIKVWKLGGD